MHFEALRWLLLHGHHARHFMHLRGGRFANHHHVWHHGARMVHKWTGKRTGR